MPSSRALGSRPWALPLAGALLGALIGLMLSVVQPEVYSARSELLVSPRTESALVRGEQRLELVTELEVARSSAVEQAAEQELGFEPFIDVQQIRSSAALSITAEADTADRAVQAAETYARVFVEVRRQQLLQPLERLRAALGRQAEGLTALAATTGGTAQGLQDAAAALDDPELAQELGLLSTTLPADPDSRVSVAVLRLAVVQRKLDELDVAVRAVEAGDPVTLGPVEPPEGPVRPRTVINVLLGALVGAAAGASVDLLRAQRRRTDSAVPAAP